MKPLPLNRLAALEKTRLRERPIHLLWWTMATPTPTSRNGATA
jgi:hypothetical protein